MLPLLFLSICMVSGTYHSPSRRGRFRKLIETNCGNVTIPRLIMHDHNLNESAKLFFSRSDIDEDTDSETLTASRKTYPLLSPASQIPDSPSHFQTACTLVCP